MIRKLLLCILVSVSWVSVCWSASSFPDRFDPQLQQAAKRYLPQVDWRLLKAQFYQESRLDPDAVSGAGAAGIAQFMPGTWLEVSRELGFKQLNRHMAKPAIQAGAYYMAKMRRVWSAPRPEADKQSLALASYNAGAGNLLRAQRACKGANPYRDIVRCLPGITGKHSRETVVYVHRIWRYWVRMMVGG